MITGVIQNMTDETYDKAEGIRRSDLFLISKTPLHFKYALEHPREASTELEFGTAAHKYILEPEDFWNEYELCPEINKRTKAGKQEWEEFVAYCEGNKKKPLTTQDYKEILALDDAFRYAPFAKQLLTGKHEVPFFWTDTETGVKCKCKPDCLTVYEGRPLIVDYKTTRSCADGHFERACREYGYKLQVGMYVEGLFNNTFEEYGFAFVAQEKAPPYAIRVYMCDDSFIDEGRMLFHDLLGIYHMCEENNRFYGYEGPFNMPTDLVGDLIKLE